MDIKQFAEQHRLYTSLDVDGMTITEGKHGQIYENGDGRFGVIFASDEFKTREGWNTRRGQLLDAGMEIHQDGDYEGSALFDPSNAKQAKMAIRISKCRPKRIISPENLSKLLASSESYRFPVKLAATEA